MKKSSLGKKEGDSVGRVDGNFEPHILYSRTSKSHRLDLNEAVDRYKFVEGNDPFDRLDMDSDGSKLTKPERRPSVTFSSLDNVKVFYPDPAGSKISSKNRRSRWTIEDKVMQIGATYMGHLNKRIEVMPPISEISQRSQVLSSKTPDIISVKDRSPQDLQAREILRTQLTGGKSRPLAQLIKVHRKEWAEGNKMAAGRCTSRRQAKQFSVLATSFGIERQLQENILPKKSHRNNAVTRTNEPIAAITKNTVPKLPDTTPYKSSTGRPNSHRNLGESQNIQRVNLSFLPHPPNAPKGEKRRMKNRKY